VALGGVIALWIRLGSEAECVPLAALDASSGAHSTACHAHIVTDTAAALANDQCLVIGAADSEFVPVGGDGKANWKGFVLALLWWFVGLAILEFFSLFIINRTHRGLRHMVKRGLQAADRITKSMDHADGVVSESRAAEVCAHTWHCVVARGRTALTTGGLCYRHWAQR